MSCCMHAKIESRIGFWWHACLHLNVVLCLQKIENHIGSESHARLRLVFRIAQFIFVSRINLVTDIYVLCQFASEE